jgi:hypothetical protein
MEAQNNREQKDSPRRHIFTRMVPTAVLVFLLFFTFFPRFGNPVSNLRRLGQGSDTHLATGRSPAAQTVATGLQQLQASGELRSYLPAQGSTAPQTLAWDGAGRLLTITAGNTVDLSSLAGATSAVDLTSYLKNTNSQSLGLSGSALTITGGNTINLAPINTDNQTVSLTGSNLTISGGNTVNLASINTDVLAGLSCSAGQLAQWNGSVWACASPAASSDAQTLSLAGDNLTILNGNSVSLAGYLDNTDSQSLRKLARTTAQACQHIGVYAGKIYRVAAANGKVATGERYCLVVGVYGRKVYGVTAGYGERRSA